MLIKIKKLLGLTDNTQDAVLRIMLDDARRAVLAYCHINKLNADLEAVVRSIVIDEFNTAAEGNIQSIKRGDTQITYNNPINVNSFNDKQKALLNHHRKVRVG